MTKTQAVYVVKDGQVITLPFIEFTPRYVKFDTGTRDSALPWCAYADRQAFEAGKPARYSPARPGSPCAERSGPGKPLRTGSAARPTVGTHGHRNTPAR